LKSARLPRTSNTLEPIFPLNLNQFFHQNGQLCQIFSVCGAQFHLHSLLRDSYPNSGSRKKFQVRTISPQFRNRLWQQKRSETRDPALGAWNLGLKKAFIEKLRYLQSNFGGETDFDSPDEARIEWPPQKKTRLESRLAPNASL